MPYFICMHVCIYACSPDLHTYLVAFFQEEREGGEDTYLGRKLIYPDLPDVGILGPNATLCRYCRYVSSRFASMLMFLQRKSVKSASQMPSPHHKGSRSPPKMLNECFTASVYELRMDVVIILNKS